MRTRRTTCLLIAFLLTSSPAWAACELGLPGEGGCEQQAAQPKENEGNITAGEWWEGLKSSVKQMGNDISNTAKHAEQSLEGNSKENQGNGGHKEKGEATAQNAKPAAAGTSGAKQGKTKQQAAAGKPAAKTATSETAAK